ncbi:hypothetical protein ACFFK0_27575 [Paenibacillus chartarius]|uniref:Transposase n=1 Tax=Paenibacillus chartarius TaxID=747481 RepID=A0ABV6DU29_9BACL
MTHSSLSGDSTIYSYKLVKKVRHSLLLITPYWALLALFAFAQSLRGGWIWLPGAALGVLMLHAVITRLRLWMMTGGTASVWGWRFGVLWNGVLPEGFAPLGLFRRVQRHLTWIGLAAVGLLYPWLPADALLDLLFFHVWLLLPRWWVLLLFTRKTKSGWVKINPNDTSCYVQ